VAQQHRLSLCFSCAAYEIRHGLDLALLTNQNGLYFHKTHLATLDRFLEAVSFISTEVFTLAYTSNILLTWKVWNWERHFPVSPPATRLVATVFWLRSTDQRRNSWLSKVRVHTDSAIQINQHNFQQSWQFSLHRKSVYYVYR